MLAPQSVKSSSPTPVPSTGVMSYFDSFTGMLKGQFNNISLGFGDKLGPAFLAGGLLAAYNYLMQQSTDDILKDSGLIFGSYIAGSVVSDLLPQSITMSTDVQTYLFKPILTSIIYEYIYNKSIRTDLQDYPDLLRSPTYNYGLVYVTVLLSEMFGQKLVSYIV